MADIQFQDIDNQRNSDVWSHFLYNNAQQTLKCNLCSVILKAGGSSTESLISHLKSKHRINENEAHKTISAIHSTRYP